MSNINVMRKNLGPVTAYKYAVQQGYTGTEQEFAALMASYATVAEEAEAAKDDAIDAKTAAEEAQAAAEQAAEQAEGAVEVDDTLSVKGRAADAKVTGKGIKNALKLIEECDDMVDYDYSVPYEREANPSSTDSYMLGVKRYNNLLILDGTATKNIIIRVNGDIATTISSATVRDYWQTGISLKEGINYIAKLKMLSGTSLLDDEIFTPSISVYKKGQSSTVGTASRSDDGFEREFTADGSDYNICVYVDAGTVLSNAEFLLTLKEKSADKNITASELDEFLGYFDKKTNLAHNLIDYGYGADKTILPIIDLGNSGTAVGVERYRTIIKLNLADNGYSKRVFIAGEIFRTSGESSYKRVEGRLQLKEGYKYRVRIKHLSGTSIRDNANYMLTIAVYDVSASYASIASKESGNETEGAYTFTSPSGKVNIVIYIPKNTVLTDAIYNVTLEEVTDNGKGFPDYYLPEMTDSITKIRDTITEPALIFPMVTDIHRYSSNAAGVQTFSQMIAGMKYLASECKLDFVLNLGDLTDGNTVQATTLQRAYDCTKDFMGIGVPYLWANGNHDTNYATSGQPYLFTMAENYKAYFTATKGVIYNAHENGTDYYLDYENLKTRIIILNANNLLSGNVEYSYGDTTAAWLSGALDTEYAVILCMHQSPIRDQVYNRVSTDGATAIINVLQSFVDNGKTLIMLSGHSHFDMAFVEPWLSVMTDCQRFTDTEGYILTPADDTHSIIGFIDNIVKPARVQYTVSEDAWTICVYKPDSNEFDMIRFGAGTDRYFHVTPISPTTLNTKLTGTVTWSTSDSSVATVSDGVVTGVETGKCAIIAKDEAGNYECWIVENES